ncbi:GGDEF domain-containing protein [Rhodobacteraceae bacterium XHP0102]|nr:GGDEF domain-containing protein [Rhodobacteraceae bacterium XHP0102]
MIPRMDTGLSMPLPVPDWAVLAPLLPMHLACDAGGRVTSVGPTAAKMLAAASDDLLGRDLFDLVIFKSPKSAQNFAQLHEIAGARVQLCFVNAPQITLRAVVSAWADGAVLSLSLGLNFVQGIAEWDLHLSDFPHTDQTVELLYLQEANNAVTRESRALTERLFTARALAEREALTDPLTGLANRRALERALPRLLSRADRPFALMHIDLDRFKAVNDGYGHAAGDMVLAQVGRILRSDIRAGDFAARMGGDEFVIMLSHMTDPATLGELAARLIKNLETPVAVEGGLARISASIGIAISTDFGQDARAMLRAADEALYNAKGAGRGGFAYARVD